MFLLWLLIKILTVGNSQIEYMESLRIWEGLNESPVLFRRVATNVDEGGVAMQTRVYFQAKAKDRSDVYNWGWVTYISAIVAIPTGVPMRC